MLQRLRFADPVKRIAPGIFHQIEDTDGHTRVRGDPMREIFHASFWMIATRLGGDDLDRVLLEPLPREPEFLHERRQLHGFGRLLMRPYQGVQKRAAFLGERSKCAISWRLESSSAGTRAIFS
jgi:hypothetical protein